MMNLKIFEQVSLHEYKVKLGIAEVKIILDTEIGIKIFSEICYKGVKFILNKKKSGEIKRSNETQCTSDNRTILISNSKILSKLIDLDVSKDYDEIMYKELIKCMCEKIYYDILDQILSPETIMFKETKEKREMLHDIKLIIKRFVFEVNVMYLKNTFIDEAQGLNKSADISYFLGRTQRVYKVVPKDGNVFNRNPINLTLIRSTLPYEESMNKFRRKYREGIDKEFMDMVHKQMTHRLTTDIIPVIE